jgi:hypothetical protein
MTKRSHSLLIELAKSISSRSSSTAFLLFPFQVSFYDINADERQLLLHVHLRGGVVCQVGRNEPTIFLLGE